MSLIDFKNIIKNTSLTYFFDKRVYNPGEKTFMLFHRIKLSFPFIFTNRSEILDPLSKIDYSRVSHNLNLFVNLFDLQNLTNTILSNLTLPFIVPSLMLFLLSCALVIQSYANDDLKKMNKALTNKNNELINFSENLKSNRTDNNEISLSNINDSVSSADESLIVIQEENYGEIDTVDSSYSESNSNEVETANIVVNDKRKRRKEAIALNWLNSIRDGFDTVIESRSVAELEERLENLKTTIVKSKSALWNDILLDLLDTVNDTCKKNLQRINLIQMDCEMLKKVMKFNVIVYCFNRLFIQSCKDVDNAGIQTFKSKSLYLKDMYDVLQKRENDIIDLRNNFVLNTRIFIDNEFHKNEYMSNDQQIDHQNNDSTNQGLLLLLER